MRRVETIQHLFERDYSLISPNEFTLVRRVPRILLASGRKRSMMAKYDSA